MDLAEMQEAIRREKLDGWLFYNFKHRDRLADSLFGIDLRSINTRMWFYVVPARGIPAKITHSIEMDSLDSLPGKRHTYTGRSELEKLLGSFGGKRYAANTSETLPIISFLDLGTARLLERSGIQIHSSAALIQRLVSLLDTHGKESHERAADALYDIVEMTWTRLRESWRDHHPSELEVQRWISEGLADRKLLTDHDPIVAAGKHSANPHYAPGGVTGADPIESETVVQFDVWAKEPDGIYADISWVGYTGARIPNELQTVFETLISSRDGAVEFIASNLDAGHDVSGAAVDEFARSKIIAAGFERGIRHRTGHGIDVECHGSGVNLDSVEFPDTRLVLNGSLFSIEPGIYLDSFGMRTEIDVYIETDKPIVSGKNPQIELLNIA